MKVFKKRRTKIPREGAIARMVLKQFGPVLHARYLRESQMGIQFPKEMRETTLVRMHPKDRKLVEYFPDMRSFVTMPTPNRTMPITKYLDLFKGILPKEQMDKTIHDLTNYRFEVYRSAEDFIRVYSDENVHSCESSHTRVACYAHPENNLGIAALYAPGSNLLVARTIVNVVEKWYVRIFSDKSSATLLVGALNEHGYFKLTGVPAPFKMYGRCPFGRYVATVEEGLEIPFFDFPKHEIVHHPETYNPVTKLFDITVR